MWKLKGYMNYTQLQLHDLIHVILNKDHCPIQNK